jgi:hypothetical protein
MGGAPEPVWTTWRREKSCTARNQTRAVQPVAIQTPTQVYENIKKRKELSRKWEGNDSGKKEETFQISTQIKQKQL